MRAKIVAAVIVLLLGFAADLSWRKGSVIKLLFNGIGGSFASGLHSSSPPREREEAAAKGGADDRCGDDAGNVKVPLDWPAGQSKLSLNSHADLVYRPTAAATPTIEGPANLVKHMHVDGGRLMFDCKPRGRSARIIVSGVTIDNFEVNSSSNLQLDDVHQSTLKVTISGSGNLSGNGQADSMDVNVAGSGRLNLGQLLAKTAKIEVSGSGEARLAVEQKADITINGVGHVGWAKRPAEVTKHINGMGHIDDSES